MVGYNTQAVCETAAVPCKLNNVKMTFITLDNYNGLFKRKRKNSQRKFLSKFARQIIRKIDLRHYGALDTIF